MTLTQLQVALSNSTPGQSILHITTKILGEEGWHGVFSQIEGELLHGTFFTREHKLAHLKYACFGNITIIPPNEAAQSLAGFNPPAIVRRPTE